MLAMVHDVWTRCLEANQLCTMLKLFFFFFLDLRCLPYQLLNIGCISVQRYSNNRLSDTCTGGRLAIKIPGYSHSSCNGQLREESFHLAYYMVLGALSPPLLYHNYHSIQREIFYPTGQLLFHMFLEKENNQQN